METIAFTLRLPIFFAGMILGTAFWILIYAIRVPFLPVTLVISWLYARSRNDTALHDDHCGGLFRDLSGMYRDLYWWLYTGRGC